MKTMYLVLTTKLAVANFHKRRGNFVPMLNDNLGDRCHHALEDAVAAGLNIAETLDQKSADITIVHVTYSPTLHEELAFRGHIKGATDNDFFGKPLWTLTREGARRLNNEAKFTMEVYPLPVDIKDAPATTSTAVH